MGAGELIGVARLIISITNLFSRLKDRKPATREKGFPFDVLDVGELEAFLVNEKKLTLTKNTYIERELAVIRKPETTPGFKGIVITGFASVGKTRYALELILRDLKSKTEQTKILTPKTTYMPFDFDFRNIPKSLASSTVILLMDDVPKYYFEPSSAKVLIGFYESPSHRLIKIIEALEKKVGKLFVLCTARKEDLLIENILEDFCWEYFEISEIKDLTAAGVSEMVSSLEEYYKLRLTDGARSEIVNKMKPNNLEALVYFFEKRLSNKSLKTVDKKGIKDFEAETYKIWEADTLTPLLRKRPLSAYIYGGLNISRYTGMEPFEDVILALGLSLIAKEGKPVNRKVHKGLKKTIVFLEREGYFKTRFVGRIPLSPYQKPVADIKEILIPDYQFKEIVSLDHVKLFEDVFVCRRLLRNKTRQLFYGLAIDIIKKILDSELELDRGAFFKNLFKFGIKDPFIEMLALALTRSELGTNDFLKITRKKYFYYRRNVFIAGIYSFALLEARDKIKAFEVIVSSIEKEDDKPLKAFGYFILSRLLTALGAFVFSLRAIEKAKLMDPSSKIFLEEIETVKNLIRAEGEGTVILKPEPFHGRKLPEETEAGRFKIARKVLSAIDD